MEGIHAMDAEMLAQIAEFKREVAVICEKNPQLDIAEASARLAICFIRECLDGRLEAIDHGDGKVHIYASKVS